MRRAALGAGNGDPHREVIGKVVACPDLEESGSSGGSAKSKLALDTTNAAAMGIRLSLEGSVRVALGR